MTVLDAAARQALASGRLVHLVTLNPDGSPQVTLVWAGLDGEDIVSAHLQLSQKLRNVRRDPRVVLSLETGGRSEIGLDHYLVIHGRAVVSEGGAPQLLQALAHVYLGPDAVFPPFENPPAGYVLRVTPDRVGGIGPGSTPSA